MHSTRNRGSRLSQTCSPRPSPTPNGGLHSVASAPSLCAQSQPAPSSSNAGSSRASLAGGPTHRPQTLPRLPGAALHGHSRSRLVVTQRHPIIHLRLVAYRMQSTSMDPRPLHASPRPSSVFLSPAPFGQPVWATVAQPASCAVLLVNSTSTCPVDLPKSKAPSPSAPTPNTSNSKLGAGLSRYDFTYSVPFNAALKLTISLFSRLLSFFSRTVSVPCSLSFVSSSSLSSLPFPLIALTILPSSPWNRS